MAQELVYTAWTPFGGCGGGALGLQAAHATVKGIRGRFRLLGGLDIEQKACDTFEYLTGVHQLCSDIRNVTPAKLRAYIGDTAPDLTATSAPCQASSQLITNTKALEPKYEALNELTLVLLQLMLATWDELSPVMVFENVPNIRNRARKLLDEVRRILQSNGYVVHDEAHELGKFGFMYDAGEVGGLAQSRKRWLMVARCPRRVPAPIHLPPPLRHRAVGEVLESLCLPNDPVGGPMHVMPGISVLNWLRLALIPAGGDHRDLPAQLARYERRYKSWIAGAVPQANNPNVHAGKFRVNDWSGHASTVTTAVQIGSGAQSVADVRIHNTTPFSGPYGVTPWDKHSPTVASSGTVRNRPVTVADPRVMAGDKGWWGGVLGVTPWSQHSSTITAQASPTKGAFSVADARVPNAYDRGYGVLAWGDTSPTVAAGSHGVGQGAYSIADHRAVSGLPFDAIGPIPLDEVLVMLHEPGPWAIVNKHSDGAPILVIDDVTKKPPVPLVIVAEDKTWHRPFTPLELAMIQGFPATVGGKPLSFAGSGSTDYREQVGNAIPPPALCAVGQMFLRALLQSELGAYEFGADGGFWVERRQSEWLSAGSGYVGTASAFVAH